VVEIPLVLLKPYGNHSLKESKHHTVGIYSFPCLHVVVVDLFFYSVITNSFCKFKCQKIDELLESTKGRLSLSTISNFSAEIFFSGIPLSRHKHILNTLINNKKSIR
jgi:hypothetical protein